jgi:hypothetical protein
MEEDTVDAFVGNRRQQSGERSTAVIKYQGRLTIKFVNFRLESTLPAVAVLVETADERGTAIKSERLRR